MEISAWDGHFPVPLNGQQRAAVECTDGPVLLLAVPGSGKTTVLVARLGYLRLVSGIAPEQILTMTYTVAAARDMRLRYASFFGQEEGERMEFRTINGVCSRIIAQYERLLNRQAFQLMEEGQKNAILGQLYLDQTGEYPTPAALKALSGAITFAKNQMLRPEELTAPEGEPLDFAALFRAYNKTLQSRQQMDYDDQMVYALRILRQYPQVLSAFQRRYRYFCVDEAQDTSKIQHQIIRLLASETCNLFMVGDEDQSIYSFRAAYPQALMEFEQVYPRGRVLYMEENYRSTPQIVSAANRFIAQNQNRRPKQMRSTREDGPQLRRVTLLSRQKQYPYLAKVAKNCARETAVLYRDNDSALPLIDLLDRSDIPYRCRQVDSLFFTSRVVCDFRNVIRFAQNSSQGSLFLSFYYKLGAGISRAAAQTAAAQGESTGRSVLEVLAGLPGVSPWTQKRCRELQGQLRALLDDPGDDAVYRLLHNMGYGDWIRERGQDQRRADILHTLGRAQPSAQALLDRLDELAALVRAGAGQEGCPFVLSTIHSSKGLEYDRVILMDVVDGLLPKVVPDHALGPEEREVYEEERRLFYVAMTRAKNELTLFAFSGQGDHSCFVDEVIPPKDSIKPAARPVDRIRTLLRRERQPTPDTASFTPAARVIHRRFGPGEIKTRNGDIVTVSFDDGAVKKLSLSTALRGGQLQLESGDEQGSGEC